MQPLVAFNNERVMPVGMIKLKVRVVKRIIDVNFLIVDYHSIFNAIMGRAWIHSIKAIVSTLHQVMRCQSPYSTYTIDIYGDQEETKKMLNYSYKVRGKDYRRASYF